MRPLVEGVRRRFADIELCYGPGGPVLVRAERSETVFRARNTGANLACSLLSRTESKSTGELRIGPLQVLGGVS